MKRIFHILIFLPSLLTAQQNLQLNREFGLSDEKEFSKIQKGDSIFKFNDGSSVKPRIVAIQKDNRDKSKKLFYRKLKKESLFIVSDTADKFHLTIDPILNFEFGKDMADTSGEKLYKNTRGFIARGSIGEKFYFETSFYENQSTFTKYIDSYIVSTDDLFPQTNNYNYNVVPGQGRSKAFKKNGYDYAMASGYISYSPNKFFNIQLGHGKHFIGDGYRSLLLSDNAFNYPFARITTIYKNIQYTNLYTSFMNLTNGGAETPPNIERLFQKKVGSFQLLSINLWKRLQIGFFQGMIWEAADSTNRQHLSFNTFDPIIGVNTAVYGLHDKNNVLLGSTLKLKLTNSISLFGQYMLDDVYSRSNGGDVRSKHGYQIGFKYFDLFTIKNLHLQFEYNTVRPYAYAAEDPQQSYTHYNQALAHPLGANFQEMIGFINYRLKDFFVEVKMNYAVKGLDSMNYNFGGNIFRSSDTFPISQSLENISTTQGLRSTVMFQDIHFGYLVNPSTNLNILIGFSNRTEKTIYGNNSTQFIYFGIRTSLTNFYYDF